MFFGQDQDGIFFRLAHITSSRFEEEIDRGGLLMQNTIAIRNKLLRASGLNRDQIHAAIADIGAAALGQIVEIERRARSIYFYPVSELFAAAVRNLSPQYCHGGEYYQVCKTIIDQHCVLNGVVIRPTAIYEPRVVIAKFYKGGNAIEYFDVDTVRQIAEDYKAFQGGRAYPTGLEFSVHANISRECIESIMTVDDYLGFVRGYN